MKLSEILDVFDPPKEPTVAVTGALLDELKALPPGKVLQITGRDGRAFVIIDAEDFRHVAGLGGIGLSPTVTGHKS